MVRSGTWTIGPAQRFRGGVREFDRGARREPLESAPGSFRRALPDQFGVTADRGDVRARMMREGVDEVQQVSAVDLQRGDRVVVEAVELGGDGQRGEVDAALVERDHRAVDGAVTGPPEVGRLEAGLARAGERVRAGAGRARSEEPAEHALFCAMGDRAHRCPLGPESRGATSPRDERMRKPPASPAAARGGAATTP